MMDSGVKVSIPSHEIGVDKKQNPKNYYKLVVNFGENKIIMDKVYGDFKKLHKHIVDTFENEIKEWEKFL